MKTLTNYSTHTATNTYEATRSVLASKSNNRTGGTAPVVSSFGYSVNPIGQRTSVARVASGVTGSTAWGYDGFGQVTSADDSNSSGDRTYQYDAIGNRKKSADSLTLPGSDNYASNALNQYTTIPNVPPTPTYDFDGNATAYPMPAAPAQNSLLSWDGENRLIYTSVYGTGTIVTYQYDALGRRIAQNISGTSGSTKATYVYDGWNCIAEYEGAANTLHAANLWGLDLSGSFQGAGGVGGLLAVNYPTGLALGTYRPLYDGNGNIT